ncbi:three-helix bundle dimerization domain-containing protein [Phytohabitans flavus]|uniref:three-helix bundle dimerization domain-containing protein n=1 Tax=Phytohabitans flavus TaxID=1076124 RepID=UPI00363ACD71
MTSEQDRPLIDEELREQFAVDHLKQALTSDFGDHPATEVEQAVEDAREQYADAPVRDFVPNLVERDARDRLKESG